MIICAVHHPSQGFLGLATMEVYHHSDSVGDGIRDAGGMGFTGSHGVMHHVWGQTGTRSKSPLK